MGLIKGKQNLNFKSLSFFFTILAQCALFLKHFGARLARQALARHDKKLTCVQNGIRFGTHPDINDMQEINFFSNLPPFLWHRQRVFIRISVKAKKEKRQMPSIQLCREMCNSIASKTEEEKMHSFSLLFESQQHLLSKVPVWLVMNAIYLNFKALLFRPLSFQEIQKLFSRVQLPVKWPFFQHFSSFALARERKRS